eukprot:1196229-Prorocentrum_minimum.AAC.4
MIIPCRSRRLTKVTVKPNPRGQSLEILSSPPSLVVCWVFLAAGGGAFVVYWVFLVGGGASSSSESLRTSSTLDESALIATWHHIRAVSRVWSLWRHGAGATPRHRVWGRRDALRMCHPPLPSRFGRVTFLSPSDALDGAPAVPQGFT